MTIEQEIHQNKGLRRDIDTIIQDVKALPPSRERSLSITKLQEAVMWLGMDLERIRWAHPDKVSDPYPTSELPEFPKIEPTADGLRL